MVTHGVGLAPAMNPDQHRLALQGAMAALFLAAMGNTIVGTMLPAVVADLGGFDRYAWASTSYMVTSTTAMPIAGRLADLYGRRIMFLVGVAVFTLASVAIGLSQTMNQFIAFRALQGIGGGVTIINAISAAGDLAPPEERGRYHGVAGAVFGLAAVAGPLAGGLITDRAHWGWAFLVNVPIGLVVLARLARSYPGHAASSGERPVIDYAGIAALVAGTMCVLVALSVGGVLYPWGSWQVIGPLAFGLAITGLFIAIESRAAWPIVPLAIYRIRTVLLSVSAFFLIGFTMFGGILFIPLYFQAVQGTSAAQSGAFLVPILLGIVVGAAASGNLLSRSGVSYRAVALPSTVLAAAGMLALSTLAPETGVAVALAYILAMGIGIGGVTSAFTVAAQNAVPHGNIGAATAALQLQRSVGGTVGVAVMAAVVAQGASSRFLDILPEALHARLPDEWRESMAPAGSPLDSTVRALPGGAETAESVSRYFTTALSGALDDAFVVGGVAAAFAVVCALLLRGKAASTS